MWSSRHNNDTNIGSLGIDIGTREIKYLYAEKDGHRTAIRAVGSIHLEPGSVVEGVIKSPKTTAKLLSNELNRLGVPSKSAVFSIPSRLAVLRWVGMPVIAPEETRSAARFKVQRHLPFPTSAAYIEACPADDGGDLSNAQHLVIAVRREVIDSRAETLETAGLLPIRAELEAQAILRVVENKMQSKSPLWRDASLTIIDVGSESTHMYVVQKQRLQFLRGVRFGSSMFINVISKELGISYETAEAIFSEPETELVPEGILKLNWQGETVLVGVRAELDKLTREFLRLFRYFRSLHPERSYAGILDHLLLCGGIAALSGFAQFLGISLGLRVEPARPFSGMICTFNRESFRTVSRQQDSYSVAMGLALSGLKSTQSGTRHEYDRNEYVWLRAA